MHYEICEAVANSRNKDHTIGTYNIIIEYFGSLVESGVSLCKAVRKLCTRTKLQDIHALMQQCFIQERFVQTRFYWVLLEDCCIERR